MAVTIVTTLGQQAIANAIANDTTVQITRIAVGDGNGAVYTPTAAQTALRKEKWSGPLNSTELNPENANQVIFEAKIAANVGGFYIREVGLYDKDNVLIAISDFPESFKALADQNEVFIRMVLSVASANAIVVVNPNLVFATKKYVDDAMKNKDTEEKIEEVEQELATHKLEYASFKNEIEKEVAELENANALSIVKSGKDSEGIFTTVNYRRKSDSSVYATSILSGGTSPQYTTRTLTFYESNGISVKTTKVYTLSYDSDGDLISEV